MHILVAGYLQYKPPAIDDAPKQGQQAVQDLVMQGIPVISGGKRLDSSAWDSRPAAAQPEEPADHG